MIYYNQKLNVRCARIEGFPYHFVTEDGRVFSDRTKGGWQGLKQIATNTCKRYPSVRISYNGNYLCDSIHRIVAKYFVSGYFAGAVVNHIDGNPMNNHYTNLEWCTQKYNINESYKTSGMNQIRNFKMWIIEHPDGTRSRQLKGAGEIKKYLADTKLDHVKYNMLAKHKHNKGYKLIEV